MHVGISITWPRISKSSINVHIPDKSLDLEIDNTLKAIKSLYAKLKKFYKKEIGDVVFVFESTGSYSALLYRFCADKGIKVYMPNPKQARNFAKAIAQRNKSDLIDARMLSEAIKIAKPQEISVPVIDPTVEEINEIMGYYKLKVKLRVQLSNHLESLSVKRGSKALISTLKTEIKKLKKQEKAILQDAYMLIEKDDILKQKYDAIISIRGIGDVAAIVLLHLFIKYPDANQRQIVSLAGLDPITKESGSSIRGKVRISKAGGRLYRGTLFMPTMVAIRHNKQMKAFYERLKANGKHTTAAQVAVMRKLVVIAHSLYKSGEQYDEEKHNNATGRQNIEE